MRLVDLPAHMVSTSKAMIIVRCEMRCKMCRERVPGYKYFIFTDEDVTLKVEKSSKKIVIKSSEGGQQSASPVVKECSKQPLEKI